MDWILALGLALGFGEVGNGEVVEWDGGEWEVEVDVPKVSFGER